MLRRGVFAGTRYGILLAITHMNAQVTHRSLLFLICAAYCALTISYAILVPPWEAPDEPAHYLYVSQLATRWRPPLRPSVSQTKSFSQDYPYISSNNEWFQPALGYLPSAIIFKLVEVVVPEQLPQQIPPLNLLVSADVFKRANLFQHTPSNMFQVWDGSLGLLIIRIISSFWGLVVIYTAYQIGRLIEKENDWLGIAVAAWIAFLPQFTFINASVRGDTVANAIGAMVSLTSVRVVIEKPVKNWQVLGLGILMALGVLAKHTFIYVLPIGVLAIIFSNELRTSRTLITHLLLVSLPVVVAAAAYYLIYPEAQAALAYLNTTILMIRPGALSWGYIQQIPVPLFADLFYARFGWANIGPAPIWARIAFGVWLVGAVATLLRIVRRRKEPGLLPTIKTMLVLVAGVLLATAGIFRFNLAQLQPQGRLLYPALVAWAVVGFWGVWQSLRLRGRIILVGGTAGLMLIYNLVSLFFYLVPAYY